MIEPFGPNVVSSEGNLWRFHYRITAPPFGDAANHLVWVETLRQAKSVVPSWSSSKSVNLKADIYRLGVNVMASAGFGRQIDCTDDGKAVPEGHEISLLDSIMGVVLLSSVYPAATQMTAPAIPVESRTHCLYGIRAVHAGVHRVGEGKNQVRERV